MYQFLAGNNQQKQTYKILTPSFRKHLWQNLCASQSFAICCNVHQVNVGEFFPGEELHVDVGLTTVHTLVRFWVHPSKELTLQVCHKKHEKQLTCTLVERVGVIPGTFNKSVMVCSATRMLCTSKTSFTHHQLILKRIVQAAATWQFWVHTFCCTDYGYVSRSIAIHLNIWSQLETNYNFFQNTSEVLFDFQP
jgi:hypothetical protein